MRAPLLIAVSGLVLLAAPSLSHAQTAREGWNKGVHTGNKVGGPVGGAVGGVIGGASGAVAQGVNTVLGLPSATGSVQHRAPAKKRVHHHR